MTIEDENDATTGEEDFDLTKARVDGCSGWKSGSDKMRF